MESEHSEGGEFYAGLMKLIGEDQVISKYYIWTCEEPCLFYNCQMYNFLIITDNTLISSSSGLPVFVNARARPCSRPCNCANLLQPSKQTKIWSREERRLPRYNASA